MAAFLWDLSSPAAKDEMHTAKLSDPTYVVLKSRAEKLVSGYKTFDQDAFIEWSLFKRVAKCNMNQASL